MNSAPYLRLVPPPGPPFAGAGAASGQSSGAADHGAAGHGADGGARERVVPDEVAGEYLELPGPVRGVDVRAVVTDALSADPGAWEHDLLTVLRLHDDVVVVLEEEPHGPGTLRLAITTYDQDSGRRRRVTAYLHQLLLRAGISPVHWSSDNPAHPMTSSRE